MMREEQYRSYQDAKVGDRVTVSKYKGAGVVRYVGVVHTDGICRVGVELDKPVGRHNGTVNGHQYFKCPSKHGVLVAFEKVNLLAHGQASEDQHPDGFAQLTGSARSAPLARISSARSFGSTATPTSEGGGGGCPSVQGGGGDSAGPRVRRGTVWSQNRHASKEIGVGVRESILI